MPPKKRRENAQEGQWPLEWVHSNDPANSCSNVKPAKRAAWMAEMAVAKTKTKTTQQAASTSTATSGGGDNASGQNDTTLLNGTFFCFNLPRQKPSQTTKQSKRPSPPLSTSTMQSDESIYTTNCSTAKKKRQPTVRNDPSTSTLQQVTNTATSYQPQQNSTTMNSNTNTTTTSYTHLPMMGSQFPPPQQYEDPVLATILRDAANEDSMHVIDEGNSREQLSYNEVVLRRIPKLDISVAGIECLLAQTELHSIAALEAKYDHVTPQIHACVQSLEGTVLWTSVSYADRIQLSREELRGVSMVDIFRYVNPSVATLIDSMIRNCLPYLRLQTPPIMFVDAEGVQRTTALVLANCRRIDSLQTKINPVTQIEERIPVVYVWEVVEYDV